MTRSLETSLFHFGSPGNVGQAAARDVSRSLENDVCEGRRFERACKHLLDVVGAASALVMLAPLLLLIGVFIRLESVGPALFRQKRLGRGGRVFWCYKFRTMAADAEVRLKDLEHLNESQGGVLFKIGLDPRVTRLGRFLRRTSLDELPQLFNVLIGEMSLVGPRPLQIRDTRRLKVLDPECYELRLTVPPGLTGLWQVSGRSEASSQEMIRLDTDYIETWSFAGDLEVLIKTVGVVLSRRGAC